MPKIEVQDFQNRIIFLKAYLRNQLDRSLLEHILKIGGDCSKTVGEDRFSSSIFRKGD